MTTRDTDEFPVRLCCGERHAGALCNDNSVMCCLCFNKYPLSAMSETADGVKTDVCPNCATIEALQVENKRLRNAVLDSVAELAAEHQPEWSSDAMKAKGKDPIGCVICWPKDGGWPCSTAMVVDDLRAALTASSEGDQ